MLKLVPKSHLCKMRTRQPTCRIRQAWKFSTYHRSLVSPLMEIEIKRTHRLARENVVYCGGWIHLVVFETSSLHSLSMKGEHTAKKGSSSINPSRSNFINHFENTQTIYLVRVKLASPVRKANNTGNGEIEMEFTGLTLGGLQLPL